MQNYFAQIVVSELSDKLHSKVSVGKIEYEFFNSISISDLYVEDLHQETLLFFRKADAHFDFWQFFHGKILFTSVEFDRLYANLVVDSTGHSNIEFVIKAFQKPKTKDSTSVRYRIDHFELKNSTFCYTNKKLLKNTPKNVFNGNRLKFKKLNLEVSLDVFDKDTLSARVLKLNAVEQSGLVVTDLATRIYGSHSKLQLPVLDLRLPNSQLHLEDIQIKYDSLGDFKRFGEKVRLKVPIGLSYISLSDLGAFVPDFKNLRGVASLKGLISGRISSLRFQKMEIKYGKSFLFNADLDINGLPNLSEAFIYGQINDLHFEKNDLQDFVSDLSKKPFLLPKEIDQLGMIRYKGNVTGFLSNLVVYGNLNTNIGSVSTDILLKLENKLRDLTYNGTIKSSNLQVGKLLSNSQLGKVSFSFNTKGTKKDKSGFQGTVSAKVPELQFKNYSYRDIQFEGKYDGSGFDGKIDVEDDNIHAHFNGMIDLRKKLPVYDFDLKVSNTNLYALKLIDKYPGSTLSFNGRTSMVGNSLDNINGYVSFDSIAFTNQNKTLNINQIQFVTRIEPNYTHFGITSDFVNGAFSGNFRYSTINQTINQIVQHYLPAFSIGSKGKKVAYANHIDFDLTIANTKDISEVFVLPYKLEGVSTLKGYIDDKTNRVDLTGNVPLLQSNKQKIENVTIHIENPKQLLQLTTRAQMEDKNGLINMFLLASAAKDSVNAQLGWQNAQQITNAGEIHAITKFRRDNGKTAAQVSFLPTQVIISDSVWNIYPCKIDLNADSTISIHNFRFESRKQFVHIDGLASKSQNDSVNLEMNDLNLDFVMNLIKLKGISLGGNVTGKATLMSVLKQPIFEANLAVKDFTLNHKLVGDGKISSNWDKVNSVLLAHGNFVNAQNENIVVANAVYTPKLDSIDVIYNAHNFGVEFLTPYLESVVQNVKGLISGRVRMFGPLKAGLKFEGDVFLDKGQVSVKMLKTTYYLNDSVHLTPHAIEFRNIKISDQERNPATLNALLTHNGMFQHMKYNATIRGNNMLAMNTQSVDNDYFFGKAYANGTVRIYGDEKEANIWVNATSQPNTKCFIQMGGASKVSDNTFVTFVDKKIKTTNEVAVHKPALSTFNVKVNLQIAATPDAEMELIVDPVGGDVITGKGNGNLRVEFDSFSDIKLYGTYTINSGYYLFTLQNVIRKEFKVDRGSTISWTGNPYNAQVNIRALYPLNASLKDLMDKDQLASVTRTTVPVNCVLKLTDNLMKPTVNFDIDLPSSDEVVKQRVRGIINTEEMMNRQIVYLLVFNKFYTPEFVRASGSGINIGANEAISFAASTVSAQMNSWFSQVFKSNNFSFGLDWRQSDQQSSDVQAQVLYQPTNRLIVNGNFGYRNDNINTSTNANKFIGDVDVEWLLTESGKLRFKAYNHTIDRYQLSTARTTQGAGFLYKEDFANFDDLFNYYWHLLTGNKKKKTNE